MGWFPCYQSKTPIPLIDQTDYMQQPTQPSQEFHNSAHLTPSHHWPQVFKSRCNPCKLQVAIQIGSPEFHVSPSSHMERPSLSSTGSWCGGYPQLKKGPLSGWKQPAVAGTCHITLSTTVRPGHLHTAWEGKQQSVSESRPNTRKQGRLFRSQVQRGTWEILFPLRQGHLKFVPSETDVYRIPVPLGEYLSESKMDKDALVDYEYPDLDPLPTKIQKE